MPNNHRSSPISFLEGRESAQKKKHNRTQTIIKPRQGFLRSFYGTWMKEKTIRTMTAPNKKGPRKLKSWPLLAAQNV